jgi:sodium-coupled neutral amino acid transporter 11
MPKDDRLNVRKTEQADPETEEARSLLTGANEDEDLIVHAAPSEPLRPPLHSSRRQSSLSKPPKNGNPRTPRTPNRVRFDIEDPSSPESNGHAIAAGDMSWMEEEDYMNTNGNRRGSTGQRAPLLTDIEAPSVTMALSPLDFHPEDYLESARPKSGMKSAFMNMANSIIGAGIIGQPYAFRQAGLVMGIILLVSLTITVDWTIRLIVVNSKLSGADSFQATVEHCFGKSGLVAISIAQWAFAFGGMVAFCIIVGDTIPHVLSAIFPSLANKPFLWLLTDRRAVIVLFILAVSYPLSLYRDIAKVRATPAFGTDMAHSCSWRKHRHWH